MRRVLLPALALMLAAGLSGMAGCGRAGVPPTTWVGNVCQALRPWRQQITGLNAQASREMAGAKTPRQTRDNLLRLLDGARRASDLARARVAAAGVPGVDGGRAVADRFVASLAGVRDAYGKAHDTIQALPMDRAAAFYDAVAATIDTLNKEYARAGLDTGRLTTGELRKDFDEVPACTGS